MKKISFIFILFFSSFLSLSQVDTKKPITNNKPVHYIGLSGGGVTGLGFSYRYWPSKWGIQITGIPVFFANKSGSFASIGLSALYTIKDNRFVDLYGYVGNQYLNYNQNYSYTDINGNLIESSNSSSMYNIGTGFGFKFDFLDAFDFNFQTGIGMFGIANKSFSTITTLTAEIGLYYHL